MGEGAPYPEHAVFYKGEKNKNTALFFFILLHFIET